MPYIGNITSDFSVDTGNITNKAVTATKLSPSSVGSNGQVLSVDGSGNLQWSADASGTALTGSTNNTITTVTGANAIQGEANLKFDGNKLDIDSAGQNVLQLNSTHSDGPNVTFERSGTGFGNVGSAAAITSGTATDFAVGATANLIFGSNGSNERARIDTSGRLLLGTTTEGAAAADDLTIATSAHTGLTIRSGTSSNGSLFFSDATSGASEYSGYVQYVHSDNSLKFGTNTSERMLIDSAGRLLLGTTTQGDVAADNLTIADSGHCGITIRSGSSNNGGIFFADGTGGNALYEGTIQYDHNNNELYFRTAALIALTLNSSQNATFAGTVSDSKGDLRKIPLNNITSAYTAVAADSGKTIYTNSGVTINQNVFATGDAVTIVNSTGSDITITQGTSLNLYNSADASTGNRTLAGRGMATIYFAATNYAYISGAGLS